MKKYYVVVEGEYSVGYYWTYGEENARKLAQKLSEQYKDKTIRILTQREYYEFRRARFGPYEIRRKLKEYERKLREKLRKLQAKGNEIQAKMSKIKSEYEELRKTQEKIKNMYRGNVELLKRDPRYKKVVEEMKEKIDLLNKYVNELEKIKKEYHRLKRERDAYVRGIERRLENIKKLQEKFYGETLYGVFIPETDIREQNTLSKNNLIKDEVTLKERQEFKTDNNIEREVERKIAEVERDIGFRIPDRYREKIVTALKEGKKVELKIGKIKIPNFSKLLNRKKEKDTVKEEELYTVEDIPVIGRNIAEAKKAVSQFFDKTYLSPPLAPPLTPPKDFVKGVVEGAIFAPVETPVFLANLATKPKETVEATVQTAKENPAYFIGSLIGSALIPLKTPKTKTVQKISERTLIEFDNQKIIALDKKIFPKIKDIKESIAEANIVAYKAKLDLEEFKFKDLEGIATLKPVKTDIIKFSEKDRISKIIHEEVYKKGEQEVGIRTIIEPETTKIQLVRRKGKEAEVKEYRVRILKNLGLFEQENRGALRILDTIFEEAGNVAKTSDNIVKQTKDMVKNMENIVKQELQFKDVKEVKVKESSRQFHVVDVKKILEKEEAIKVLTKTEKESRLKKLGVRFRNYVKEKVIPEAKEFIKGVLESPYFDIELGLQKTISEQARQDQKTVPLTIQKGKEKPKNVEVPAQKLLEVPLTKQISVPDFNFGINLSFDMPLLEPIKPIKSREKSKKTSFKREDPFSSWFSNIKENPIIDIDEMLGLKKKR